MAQIEEIKFRQTSKVGKDLREGEQFIRLTQSICPDCNKILPATIFEREEKVFMRKTCSEHGEIEETQDEYR